MGPLNPYTESNLRCAVNFVGISGKCRVNDYLFGSIIGQCQNICVRIKVCIVYWGDGDVCIRVAGKNCCEINFDRCTLFVDKCIYCDIVCILVSDLRIIQSFVLTEIHIGKLVVLAIKMH